MVEVPEAQCLVIIKLKRFRHTDRILIKIPKFQKSITIDQYRERSTEEKV
jgi:hypothetical protein